ncbi:hypothetical protein [Bacteroides sp. f07]
MYLQYGSESGGGGYKRICSIAFTRFPVLDGSLRKKVEAVKPVIGFC